jgi:hypothetical protein
MRSLGWAAVLAICAGLFALLSVKVHAVKSEVLLAEREIIALERETRLLETEFQARASQRQLAEWNRVEFGYVAPRADQYLDGERQLASLGEPRGSDAPAPIRVARAEGMTGNDAGPGEMVSPVSGRPVTLAAREREESAPYRIARAFGDLLSEASPIGPANARTPRQDAQGPAE